MSTDRELLEAAAKAAGIEINQWHEDEFGVVAWGEGDVHWNPLEDDGDALRLAVKLRLDFGIYEAAGVEFAEAGRFDLQENSFEDIVNGDDMAATRRAIVRAAASMADQEKAE